MADKNHGNSSNNGKVDHPLYIPSAAIRDKVNDILEKSFYLGNEARKGSREAEAEYHRVNADLLSIRPARDEQSRARQATTARYLMELADRIESGALRTVMRDSEYRPKKRKRPEPTTA